jgi:hypothetical protein
MRSRESLVIDPIGNKGRVPVEMALLFQQSRRVNEDMIDLRNQACLDRVLRLLHLRKRIFVIDVIAAQVVRHQAQSVGKRGAPDIEYGLFTSVIR